MKDHYDSPWKDILDTHLPLFLALFFPDSHADVDWSRGWTSLEQELRQLAPESETGHRIADKLFKIYLRDGGESYLLIHIEIQGEYEPGFSERMFLYNIRFFNIHRVPVMSFAVLTDSKPDWRPGSYGWDRWACRMDFQFPVVKLEDYNKRWDELEASQNPFAVVIMAHLKTKATRDDAEERLSWKARLVRQLYDKGFNRDAVVDLFRFIDWVMRLPPWLESRFLEDVRQWEKEKKMRYVSSIERLGRQEGMQIGLQKGRQEGEARLLSRLLARRYSPLPDWVGEKLEKADRQQIELWSERLLEAGSLEEVFRS